MKKLLLALTLLAVGCSDTIAPTVHRYRRVTLYSNGVLIRKWDVPWDQPVGSWGNTAFWGPIGSQTRIVGDMIVVEDITE